MDLVLAGVGCAVEGELLPTEDDISKACVQLKAILNMGSGSAGSSRQP